MKQAQFYIAQIVNVLAFFSARDLVHRDLKPGNLLLDENWHLVFTDFGTAKFLNQTDEATKGASPATSFSFT